jgi:hypothetical protein
LWVLDGSDDSRSEFDLVVGLHHVEDWHSLGGSVHDESFHRRVHVGVSDVASGFDQSEDVLLLSGELLWRSHLFVIFL